MFSITTDLPLSAGRMVSCLSEARCCEAAFSFLVMFDLSLGQFLIILTQSDLRVSACLVSTVH